MKGLSPPQAQLVGLIDEHATQLSTMTSRLLQMAKQESQEIRLHRENIFIGQFIRELIDHCAGQLCGHAIQLSLQDQDLVVSADRRLLAITITELLLNAAKNASADSPITLSAQNKAGQILISVHNLGPAIAFAERDRIFDRFYRSPTTKHRASGSGIGLSVARRAAEAHQGKMWVKSSPEAGTTFFLCLPHLLGEYADATE